MLIRRAKIVCTVGPACDDEAKLVELIHAGMDVARLNFSHGSHEEHARRFRAVRDASRACDKPVAVLQDLCGPKIRCGRFAGGTMELGESAVVSLVEARADGAVAGPGEVPIQYEGLGHDLEEGDAILLDDGRVTLTVVRIEGDRVQAVVTQDGEIRDRVGVHLPAARVRIATITEKDKADLAFGLSLGVDYVALSFVRHADDVHGLRELMRAHGRLTPIVSKIETPAAIEHLDAIMQASDAVMVARGDLGVELPPERVPILQREILGLARVYQRPVIVATEMLQSMVHEARPTRAEASDVATGVFEGTDAVMLSQETATGDHPALAASMMARIIVEAEGSKFYRPLSSEQPGARSEVNEAVARAGCDIAGDIGARVLVAFTASGLTARYASKARPSVPIIAFSPDPDTRRRLALLWGVIPFPLEALRDADELIERADAFLKSRGFASPGDKFVAIFGAPLGVVGTTNSIRVKVVA